MTGYIMCIALGWTAGLLTALALLSDTIPVKRMKHVDPMPRGDL